MKFLKEYLSRYAFYEAVNMVYMQQCNLQQMSRRDIYITTCKGFTSVISSMNIICIA